MLLTQTPRETAEPQIRELVLGMLDSVSQTTPLSLYEREALIADVFDELFGLGPLEPVLKDTEISDILVNRYNQVYIEREGRLEATPIVFRDDRHLMQIIERIVSSVGRRIDESTPMVDARLADGSRVNAIIPPLALDGPVLSIRRFASVPLAMKDIVAFGTLTEGMGQLISGLVKAKTNLLISGGTGTGKTTLLNIMSAAIPPNERIITIEDAAELKLQQSPLPLGGRGRGEGARPARRPPPTPNPLHQ